MATEKIHLIGKHILAARDLLGMTQLDLAQAAGVTEDTVNSFETGRHVPRASTVEAIRDALERRGIEFFNGDNPGVRLNRSKATIPT